MEKTVTYSGFTAAPSDYIRPDGELAAALDLWHEGGTLKPVMQPQTILTLSATQNILYVHKPTNRTHYIGYDTGSTVKLFWVNASDVNHIQNDISLSGISGDIIQITSIGNTLIVITTTQMRYYLWKFDNSSAGGSYSYLGTHLPELDIKFGLNGTTYYEDSNTTIELAESISGYDEDLSEANVRVVTQSVLAHVNKFVSEHSTKAGRFIFPFLVRYAYRLFDGTLTMQSAPVLMLACDGPTPMVHAVVRGASGNYNQLYFCVAGTSHKLEYAAAASQITVLQNWKDIISSVDIFVSSPFYTYDQSGECLRFIAYNRDTVNCVCKHTVEGSSATGLTNYQQRTAQGMLEQTNFLSERWSVFNKIVELPERRLDEQLIDNAQFYYLRSIEVADLQSTLTEVEIGDEYLQSLVNREVLTDDYDSHDRLIPSYAFSYNQRLNIAGIKKEIFKGFPPLSSFQHTDGYYDGTTSYSNATVKYYVYIRQEGREFVFISEENSMSYLPDFRYFYFPNPHAYKVVIAKTVSASGTSATSYYVHTLKPHATLNGAYYYDATPASTSSFTPPSETSERIIALPNKLYTSEVGNAFLFPLLNINTVGVGEIIGISAAAKALSQGQFGQFPLYVFASDGVWAMAVSDTGTYSSKQIISRDVCIDSHSITQIDTAVLFATDRGVILISGAQTSCISDAIDELDDKLFSFYNYPLFSALVASSDQTHFYPESFHSFLSGCRIAYDYRSQRLILFNTRNTTHNAYVYAMDGTKTWSVMRNSLSSVINSFPECYAMTSDHKFVDLSKRTANTYDVNGLSTLRQYLVTRPLKLDFPDGMKTIRTVIQRGNFARGHVRCVLYGSRDLINWFAVFSSTDHYLRGMSGTPYKYFRIALSCNLRDYESVSAAFVQFEAKLGNQPR